jgi:AAA ATPase-like protein
VQWRPSTAFDGEQSSEMWAALSGIYNSTVSMEPLCRGDENVLRNDYVRRRRNDAPYIDTLRSVLPPRIRNSVLGSTEIELITFLLQQRDNRILNVEGPRGVGKTTLLHFVENTIQEARLKVTPSLLLLDGRQLREAQDITESTYLGLIRDELKNPRVSFDPSLRPATARLAAKLEASLDLDRLRHVFRALVDDLPEKDPRLLTIVFDNLDQLPASAISAAADLSKTIYYSSGIGSVLCLRPGSRTNLMQTASARALFAWVIPVEPPAVDAWLDRLAERMRNTAKTTTARLGSLGDSGIQLTPERLLLIMQRFAALIKRSKHRGQSIIEVMDGMCGGDIRLLSRLVFNLMAHRTFPQDYLLTAAHEPSFRPVTAMLEGQNVVARSVRGDGRSAVPNLLWYRTATGGIDLLLYHRILGLLDDFPIKTSDLIHWLTALGHTHDDTKGAIADLATYGLVGMSDREHLLGGDMPAELFNTRSGYYYRDHLLSDADYLLAMVTDVPLAHNAVRRGTTPQFSHRIISLSEYARRIIEEEQLLLVRAEAGIARRASRAIIDRLAHSGFFSQALLRALSSSIEHHRTASPRIMEAITEARPAIDDLRAWVVERETRIRALRTTLTIRSEHSELEPLVASSSGMRVEVRAEQFGDDIELHAEVLGTERAQAAFVAVSSGGSEESEGQVTLVNAAGEKQRTLYGKFPMRTSESMFTAVGTRVQALAIPSSVRRVGLLSVNVEDGHFALQLFIYQDGRGENQTLGIGEDAEQLRKWSRGALAEISDIVTQGKSFDADVRTVGVELCRRVCGPGGAEILASRYRLIDTLVIFTKHLDIPWEWLCIPPRRGEPDLLPIGKQWRVVRWPWDRIHGTALTFTNGFGEPPVERFGTIGIAPGGRPGWRIPIPTALPKFRASGARHDALHIVGHWDGDRQALELGRLTIKADTARTFAPVGPRHIILSACDVATTEQSANVAIALAETAACTSWAPLVKIRRDDALAFDRELASYLQSANQSGIDGFMRARNVAMPLLSLYARYGICAE